ncbi:class I SAM-dependent DNA methyltransferase [Paenibacillus sacheonensis]|uniref:Methyltransferase domain-containing protein n=1 Tax=Paenibacillus sacheonensis TaxID=742054 RepID=A0A7X4YQ13_9BACL|nr:class I SAM-dependent methyltransferase [Paenibacillus sacheonensis]MBM7565593.1 SAM-dependent methyltransferase [Paenibacillus sacheonensis]NBC69489.1 methyltransferase domain-containing protein [Paenibacillus sacheonensis]
MEAYTQFAAVYDRLMADMPYPAWIAFAESCWERYGKPATVVDLGCGTGSIALPLARSGYTVYGIDISSDMLTVGRSKQEDLASGAGSASGGTVAWLEQDMTEWEIAEPADSVLSFCDCINYLTEEDDVIAAFSATLRGLKPGGVFLFDVHAPGTLRRYAEEQPFLLDEPDIAYIWTSELDEERMEIEHHLTIFAEAPGSRGRTYARIEETHVQRAYDAEWIKEALIAVGFSKVDMFGDFKLDPADDDTERLFFAAVK